MTTPHTADIKKAGRGWRRFLIATALVSLYLNLVYALTPKLDGHFPVDARQLEAAQALTSLTFVDYVTGVLIAVVPVVIAVWLAEAVKDPLVQSWVKGAVIALMLTCMAMSIAHQAEVLAPKVGTVWAYVMPVVLDTSAMVALGLFMKAKHLAHEEARRLKAAADRASAKDALRAELMPELRAEAAAAERGDREAYLAAELSRRERAIRGDMLASVVAVIRSDSTALAGGDSTALAGGDNGGELGGVIAALRDRDTAVVKDVLRRAAKGDVPAEFRGDIAAIELAVQGDVMARLEGEYAARFEAAKIQIAREAEAKARLELVTGGDAAPRKAIKPGKSRQTGKPKPVRQGASSDKENLESLRTILEEAARKDLKPTNKELAAMLGVTDRTVIRYKQTLANSDGQIHDAEVVNDGPSGDSAGNVRPLRAG